MATRPKGYLPKGKTKSFDAVRKAKAREDLTTLKGIGGIIGGAILNSPGGRAIKVGNAANKIVKVITTRKMAKTADARRKFDAATQRRILDNQVKKSVKVLPRTTAPKTDLSNRGAKLTRVQRSERAAELSFKKAEGRYEGEYFTRMTGLKGPKGVTSQTTRGQGTRSLRKEAAINKEAKRVVKINSQRNLKKKVK